SLLTLVLHESVSAQSEERKLEMGAQISGLAGDGFGYKDAAGGGGRLTYYMMKYVAIEGELNYFSSNSSDNFHRFQGQFGVKSCLRFNRFGVFGKVRPGFINTKQDSILSLANLCVPSSRRGCAPTFVTGGGIPLSDLRSYTGFSLDVGGVAEFYPSKRL